MKQRARRKAYTRSKYPAPFNIGACVSFKEYIFEGPYAVYYNGYKDTKFTVLGFLEEDETNSHVFISSPDTDKICVHSCDLFVV